jgi:hypothetical protein
VSGHRPFVELTKHFNAEHRGRVAEECAELRSVLLLYESREDKERKCKLPVSSIRSYRSGRMLAVGKLSSLSPPVRQHERAVAWPLNVLVPCVNSRSKNEVDWKHSAFVPVERRVTLPTVLSSKQST